MAKKPFPSKNSQDDDDMPKKGKVPMKKGKKKPVGVPLVNVPMTKK